MTSFQQKKPYLQGFMNSCSIFNCQRPGYVAAGAGLLERERAKLHSIVATYGLPSPQALKQSILVDNIVLAVVRGKLE